MKYSEAIKILPSNKKFGYSFAIIFLFIFLYFQFFDILNNLRYLFIVLSFLFFILTIFNEKILFPLNLSWLYLGVFLGKIVSPIVLGIIYFIVFTPISIYFKIINRDILELKITANKSMWKNVIKKKLDLIYFKNQY